jgi:hypothetical protein
MTIRCKHPDVTALGTMAGKRSMRALLLISCLACVGCGSNSPYEYVEASGHIGYEDGTPIPAGGYRLLFSAIDAPPV